ncbi:M20 family metallo-hydrolase [Mordavella massiliensis]|uniref:M20 family metallo-hydrolase n=1 Tax=Mordavella massiliensis TaxID=1871024 RepID=A0A938X401_9CLOT|nr:M20 family metallo-hydrolase [Mordavella massiliensis]MBM6827608.1 M20 family metallo-hydrolase [Mordavella massiliensis]
MGIEDVTGRIARDLEHLKQYTATPGNGCTRLPFTKEARDAVNYLKELMTEAGLEVTEDAAGNVIGTLKGEDPDAPCVMMGSHYDSVVNGGDYDGIAGVICAIEVARILKEEGFVPKRNFVVVGFCDEEGMRFGTGYFGSGAMLGHRDVEYTKKFADTDGVTIYDAMKGYGLDPEKIGEAAWKEGSIGQFLEAHIEQGPVLDAEGTELGLVEGIVGIQRYMVTVHGRADHAGTTPMDMRMDAVDAATKVISKIADWAREKADGTVSTVGYINTVPGGMNIVAEKVEFTVDIRSMNNDNINDITNRIRKALDKEVAEYGGSYEMDNKLTITPVHLSSEMLDFMEADCKERGYTYRRMPSGAGHDSLEIGQSIPTVMIFTPSKEGRSHCPVEFTKYSEFAKASVIMKDLAKHYLEK